VRSGTVRHRRGRFSRCNFPYALHCTAALQGAATHRAVPCRAGSVVKEPYVQNIYFSCKSFLQLENINVDN